MEERHNLTMPSYLFGPYLVRHPRRANSSRLSEPQKSNLLVWRLVFNSLNFLQIPQNLRALPVRDVTRTLSPVSSSQAIVTLYYRKNTLIYKKISISHASISMFLWCEREWTQGQTAILTQIFS